MLLFRSNLNLVISKGLDGKPVPGNIRGKTRMTVNNKAGITRGFYKNSLCFCGVGSRMKTSPSSQQGTWYKAVNNTAKDISSWIYRQVCLMTLMEMLF